MALENIDIGDSGLLEHGMFTSSGNVVTATLPVGHWLRVSAHIDRFRTYPFEWDGSPNLFLRLENGCLCLSASKTGKVFARLSPVLEHLPERRADRRVIEVLLPRVSDAKTIAGLKSLQPKRIFCYDSTGLGGLAGVQGLVSLSLTSAVVDWSVFSKLPGLRELRIPGSGRTDLSGIEALKNLEDLEVVSARASLDISAVAQLHKLSRLRFTDCRAVRDLSSLAELPALKVLGLPKGTSQTQLQRLRTSGVLDRVEVLILRQSGVTDLSVLSGLPRLHTLDLSHCRQLRDFSGLNLPGLRALNLDGVTEIKNLAFMRKLGQLRAIRLPCDPSADMTPFESLKSLESLFLFGAVPSVRSVPAAKLNQFGMNGYTGEKLDFRSPCPHLRRISLYNCTKLSDFSVLEQAQSLEFFFGLGLEKLSSEKAKRIREKHPNCYISASRQ